MYMYIIEEPKMRHVIYVHLTQVVQSFLRSPDIDTATANMLQVSLRTNSIVCVCTCKMVINDSIMMSFTDSFLPPVPLLLLTGTVLHVHV